MTTTANIQMQTAPNAYKASANPFANVQSSAKNAHKDKPSDIENFIGSLLSQTDNKTAPKQKQSSDQAGTETKSADKANTFTDKTSVNETKMKETVAKIAEELDLDPADPAAAAKIMEALEDGTIENDPQLRGLTSDLAAQLSTFLNDSTQTGTIDDKLLASMKDALDAFLASGTATDEQLAAFTRNLTQQLQDQGFDDAAIAQYMQALNLTPNQSVAALLTPVQVDKALTGLSQPPVLAESEIAPYIADKTDTAKNIPPIQADASVGTGESDALNAEPAVSTAAADGAKKAAAVHTANANASQANAADVKTPEPKAPELKPAKTDERAASLAMINEMASADTTADSNATKTMDPLQSIMGLKSGDTTNTQGFVNYMQGTGRNISAPTMQMIALQIQQNANNKTSSFTMQLEPADLGRLDIEMSFDKSGTMKAHVTADKPETLAMLQRDSQHLNRILQQAGVDVDEGGLSFDLREDNSQQDMANAYSDGGRGSKYAAPGNALAQDMMNAQIAVQAMGYVSQSGVNIMV